VGGAVAEDEQRIGIAIGQDRDSVRAAKREREVDDLAVHLPCHCGLGQTFADRLGQLHDGAAVGEFAYAAVRKSCRRHVKSSVRSLAQKTAWLDPSAKQSKQKRPVSQPGAGSFSSDERSLRPASPGRRGRRRRAVSLRVTHRRQMVYRPENSVNLRRGCPIEIAMRRDRGHRPAA